MLTYTHKEEKEEEGMKRKRHRACKYEALNLDPTTHIKLDTVACICVQSQHIHKEIAGRQENP